MGMGVALDLHSLDPPSPLLLLPVDETFILIEIPLSHFPIIPSPLAFQQPPPLSKLLIYLHWTLHICRCAFVIPLLFTPPLSTSCASSDEPFPGGWLGDGVMA